MGGYMNNNLPQKICSGIFQDVLSLCGIPTSTAEAIYDSILQKRSEDALNMLFCKIRQGNFNNIDQNEFVSIIARYQRDAVEGIAKNNLRLMARLICGLNEKGQLTAPNFQKYAKILADLSLDEIDILGRLAKYKDDEYAVDQVLIELLGKKNGCDMDKFRSILATLNALTRTGFVGLEGGGMWGDEKSEYGTSFYLTSHFKGFLNYFSNWEDIATWNWDKMNEDKA